jgi:hypothetical protein
MSNKELNTEIIQIRATSAFKARLAEEARKRTTTMSKLLLAAFWAFIEDDLKSNGSLLDK